jgi:oligoribonuclease NrnB/cAMP/cGMP phosphodiesterase (DHH superfamily)
VPRNWRKRRAQMLYKKPRLVIYHGECFDGTTAGWLLWTYFRDSDTEYCPCIYTPGNPFPETKAEEIFIVDYSFPRLVIEKLIKDGKKLTLLDHHETALELEGLPGVTINKNKSGASLTYEYLLKNMPDWWEGSSEFTRKQMERYVSMVEDRDLFRFANPDSKAFTARQSASDMTFPGWDDLYHDFAGNEHQFVTEGKLILSVHRTNISKFIQNNLIRMKLFGYEIPVLNVPKEYGSDSCAEMLARFPDAPFAMYYYDDALSYTKGQYIGVRSRKNNLVNVEPLAKRFNGGGHITAAAFRTTLDRVRMLEHDMNLWEQMCPGGKIV